MKCKKCGQHKIYNDETDKYICINCALKKIHKNSYEIKIK